MSWHWITRPLAAHPAFVPAAGPDQGHELLLDIAERQLMLAVIEEDVYAEVIVVPSVDDAEAGFTEPTISLCFPLCFAGISA